MKQLWAESWVVRIHQTLLQSYFRSTSLGLSGPQHRIYGGQTDSPTQPEFEHIIFFLFLSSLSEVEKQVDLLIFLT